MNSLLVSFRRFLLSDWLTDRMPSLKVPLVWDLTFSRLRFSSRMVGDYVKSLSVGEGS